MTNSFFKKPHFIAVTGKRKKGKTAIWNGLVSRKYVLSTIGVTLNIGSLE